MPEQHPYGTVGLDVTTVLVTDGPGVSVRRARVVHHAAVRLRARALDDELIAGAPPESQLVLSLRAQQLLGLRERRGLAATLRAQVRAARDPAPMRRAVVPVSRSAVLQCATELTDLAALLARPGPVAPRGVALVHRLICEGGGPLYRRSPDGCGSELLVAIAEARWALKDLDGSDLTRTTL